MDLSRPADSHIEATRRADPDLVLAAVFVPAASRRAFWLWQAVLHEVLGSVWNVSDERVGAARLGWWSQQFEGLAVGRPPLHPLLVDMLPLAAALRAEHWQALGRGTVLLAERSPGLALVQRAAQWQPLAAAAADIGGRLAGECGSEPRTAAGAMLAWHWLSRALWRLPQHPGLCDWLPPLELQARHRCDRDALARQPWSAAARRLIADMAGQIADGLHSGALEQLAPDRGAAARLGIERLALRYLASDPTRLDAAGQRPKGLPRLVAAWSAARQAIRPRSRGLPTR